MLGESSIPRIPPCEPAPEERMRSDPPLCWTALIAVIIASVGLTSARAADGASVDFSRDVLPILSDNCFLCHGPDAKTRKADLRLDTKEGALRTNDPVIVPGKSARERADPARRQHGRRRGDAAAEVGQASSTPQQIELLKTWIDQGASWGKHWAFEPPAPAGAAAGQAIRAWARNPIDRFVLARLETEGLDAVARGRPSHADPPRRRST